MLQGVNGSSQGIAGALKFEARVQIVASGGKTEAADDSIAVQGADSALLLIDAATSYKKYNDTSGDPAALVQGRLKAAASKSFDELRQAHVAEHQRLFRRVALNLGTTEPAKRPTDERIKDFANGKDPQLAALYFQFGRYLLISCSRPGGQPATLQGLWNDSMNPPWGSKYTININTEMNYWPAEPANLGECVEPLMAMVEDLTRNRRAHRQGAMGRPRLGGPPQHRSLAGGGPDRRPLGLLAHRRRVALPEPVGTLRVQPRPAVPRPALSRH